MKKVFISILIGIMVCVGSFYPASGVFAEEESTSTDTSTSTGSSDKTAPTVDYNGTRCRCSGDPDDSKKWTGVKTGILGENNCSCDDGKGSSIIHILQLIVEIMTVGIGILGVIGISLVGVQYLTAGGDEGKVRKAKQRMLEIVIGLVLYALAYALMAWLIPDFHPFGM